MTNKAIRNALLVSAILALSACATAAIEPAPTQAQSAYAPWNGFLDHPRGYLTRESAPNASHFLPGAPAAGSAEALADIAAHNETRALSGGESWTQARADNEIETPRAPFKAFASVFGFEIDSASTPTLTYLLARVLADVEAVQHDVKRGAFRQRPYLVSGGEICIPAEDWLPRSSSYPSGHAATGWAWGLILSELAPQHQNALLERAAQYGESRLICGVHYPSDVRDGRLVGAALVARLHAEPAFQTDLAVARVELDRVLASVGREQ